MVRLTPEELRKNQAYLEQLQELVQQAQASGNPELIQMAEAQVDEWIRIFMPVLGQQLVRFPDLKIRTKERQLLRFEPNPVQVQYLDAILPEWRKYPVGMRGNREIILKARQFGFCLDPATRVLTADLRWVSLDTVKPGDRLVGVNETPPPGKGSTHSLRAVTVEARADKEAELLEIVTTRGTIRATKEHRFLVKRAGKY